jgi:hypothetical protein
VERLGWPPYLDGTSEQDFRYGANFAVASGTALSRRFFERKHLNVDEITPYSSPSRSDGSSKCSTCSSPPQTTSVCTYHIMIIPSPSISVSFCLAHRGTIIPR